MNMPLLLPEHYDTFYSLKNGSPCKKSGSIIRNAEVFMLQLTADGSILKMQQGLETASLQLHFIIIPLERLGSIQREVQL